MLRYFQGMKLFHTTLKTDSHGLCLIIYLKEERHENNIPN